MKKNSYFCAGAAVLLAGCTSISQSMTDVERRPVFDGEIPVVESIAPPVRLAKNASGGAANSSYFQTSDRMVAYTAGFTLSVKQRDAAVDDVKKLAESLKGYIVSSRKGNMTIKVPVQKADEFLKSSGKYGKVSDFYIQADDLTDTITDLTVRLDNLIF